MDYSSREHSVSTRGALGCIAIMTIIGLFLVWAFFEKVRMKPVMGEPYEERSLIADTESPQEE